YDNKVTVSGDVPGVVREGVREGLRIGEWERPMLHSGRWLRYTLHIERMPDRAREAYSQYFPKRIRNKIEQREYVDVEEFLRMREGSRLRIYVSGTDSLSGARLLILQEYEVGD